MAARSLSLVARDSSSTDVISLRNPISEIDECRVLVVNASSEMAKEITLQLTLQIPGCSIMYAPTIQLAQWILGRREIDLIVASAVLPDGSFARLTANLEKMNNPPDMVVVGTISAGAAKLMGNSKYHVATTHRIASDRETSTTTSLPIIHRRKLAAVPTPTLAPNAEPPATESIKNLGADIRNDLNNPLQEIVAMVFVAKASAESSPTTTQALEAIDKAAKNMADVVKSLEGKIANVVVG